MNFVTQYFEVTLKIKTSARIARTESELRKSLSEYCKWLESETVQSITVKEINP